MSIEDRIAELTAAIEKLTSVIEGKAAPAPKEEKPKAAKAKTKPVEEPPAAPEEPKENPTKEPVSADTPPTVEAPADAQEKKEEHSAPVTFAEVRESFLDLYKTNMTAAQALVASFGVSKLTAELIAAKGAEVMAAIKKAKAA